MIDNQCIYAIRLTRGEDLLCLGAGERRGDLFRVNSINPLAPSGQWKVTRLIQPWGFGVAQSWAFDDWSQIEMTMTTDHQRGDFWTYKNGKPRFTCVDLDHGTRRQWGSPSVRKISRWPVHTVTKDIQWRLGNLDATQHGAITRASIAHTLRAVRDFINANA